MKLETKAPRKIYRTALLCISMVLFGTVACHQAIKIGRDYFAFFEKINLSGLARAGIAPEPPIRAYEVVSEAVREVSAYNAGDPLQTDDNPCIAANGENVCVALERGHKRCAANFVDFGTRLHIENFGECLVTDRMASRYADRVDIAMKADEKERAMRFGVQRLNVKILKFIRPQPRSDRL